MAAAAEEARPWWVGAVGYEIYVRSFADSNGDGVGDLAGITARLDHVAELGVDAVWLTPFFPSPGFDHGYDVADYRNVDPIFGTLADFDALVARARSLGLRVIVDVVPNHTSSAHPWFVDSASSTASPRRDWYLWRDPGPTGGPPNNWVSHFGGPAWTLHKPSGQYYCHLFLPEQPDLNWRNPDVFEAFDGILRFWCERGVDGFRIDVAHALAKDDQFRDNPQIAEVPQGGHPYGAFFAFEHRYDLEQDENLGIFQRWNRLVSSYDGVLIGEIPTDDPIRAARYTRRGDALHRIFFLRPTWMGWSPAYVAGSLRDIQAGLGDGMAWVTSSHDQPRPVTRFGGGEVGRRRSLAVTTFMMALDGMPFLYQGQELGLDDGTIQPGGLADPLAVRNEGVSGRDGCRTAMPWTDEPGQGFTTAPAAWLRAAPRPASETVAAQAAEPDSPLARHRELLTLYHSLPQLQESPVEWLPGAEDVLQVQRDDIVAVINLGPEKRVIDLPAGEWQPRFVSGELESTDGPITGSLTVPAETAALLQRH